MAIQISMPEMPSWKVMIILGDILRIAFQLFVVVPCFGVIVRLRANYTPRGLQLDEEGTEGNRDRRVGPVVSFFGMLRRIKRIEVCFHNVVVLYFRSCHPFRFVGVGRLL